MGSVINFPRRRKNNHKQVGDFFIERLTDTEPHEKLQDVAFTCAICRHTNRFSFTGVIFKECSFYCAGCGTGYRLDNPAVPSKKLAKRQ